MAPHRPRLRRPPLIGGPDISFAVGLIVAGGLSCLFSRTLDRTAEAAARERSRMQLGVQADRVAGMSGGVRRRVRWAPPAYMVSGR